MCWLGFLQAEERFAHALQTVGLDAKSNDGYVHFGDTLMLFNQATDGCLACDPQEALSEETFATTSTWYTEPCARNTFVMKRWEGRGDKKDAMFDFKDDVVHFGQKIQLMVNPALLGGQQVCVCVFVCVICMYLCLCVYTLPLSLSPPSPPFDLSLSHQV
jgi:hypothetical protein